MPRDLTTRRGRRNALTVPRPLASLPALVRREVAFVGHAARLGEIVAQIEILQAPVTAEFDLPKDGERAGAEPAEFRIEVAINRRHGLGAAVGHGHAD